MPPTQAALGAFGLLALSAWIVAPAGQDKHIPTITPPWAPIWLGPRQRAGPMRNRVIEAAQRLATPAAEVAADHGQYVATSIE